MKKWCPIYWQVIECNPDDPHFMPDCAIDFDGAAQGGTYHCKLANPNQEEGRIDNEIL